MQQLKQPLQLPTTYPAKIITPPLHGSWIDLAQQLPPEESLHLISEALPDYQYENLDYEWVLNARHAQYLPPGNWRQWLILAGRGFGKTRLSSETVRHWVKTYQYVNIIGATADDARDVMVEGESGILAVCPKHERPIYKAHKRLLEWPNGAKSLIFSADQPDRLRGKQHMKLACDELAAWRYPEAYTQAMLGLRLGDNPQVIITTTPRPIKIIKELMKDPNTHVTRGSTYDNRNNLAPAFVEQIIQKYEGTRVGRQELYAEILDDNPNALWTRERIDELRVKTAPDNYKRIVVAIDPAVTNSEDACETGIIVAGIDYSNEAYIIDDCTMQGTADQWASRAIVAYHKYGADRIIGEANNGGDLIEALIRSKDPSVSYRKVHASRGKTKRAEPVSALYEQGRVHHIGAFPKLEDQMCAWNPQLLDSEQDSPDRMDAMVWALSDLMLKPTKEFLVA